MNRTNVCLALLIVMVALFTATPASAQPIPCDVPNTTLTTNPTRIAMTSADHMTTILGGPEFLIASNTSRLQICLPGDSFPISQSF